MISITAFDVSNCNPLINVNVIIYLKDKSLKFNTGENNFFKLTVNDHSNLIRIELRKNGYIDKILNKNNLSNIIRILEDDIIGYKNKGIFTKTNL